jgi:predicted acyltransferase
METLKTVTPSQTRLMSLDVMRGLDMFFLVALGPLLSAWQRAWGLPSWLSSQLNHVDWAGLTAWDLIMPWFIFMCGAAIPFALPKQMVEGKAGWRYWRHVLVRVVTLWVLGMVVQGNLLQLK